MRRDPRQGACGGALRNGSNRNWHLGKPGESETTKKKLKQTGAQRSIWLDWQGGVGGLTAFVDGVKESWAGCVEGRGGGI